MDEKFIELVQTVALVGTAIGSITGGLIYGLYKRKDAQEKAQQQLDTTIPMISIGIDEYQELIKSRLMARSQQDFALHHMQIISQMQRDMFYLQEQVRKIQGQSHEALHP